MSMNFMKVFTVVLALSIVPAAAAASSADDIYAASKTYTEEELGIRKEPLYDERETVPARRETTTLEPGESIRYERAFENSPPLIPHDITGMLPIAQTDNICLGCHMPEEAQSMGATPLPKSHFVDLDTGKDLGENLDGHRYNCMQCHVIQNVVSTPVVNFFKGDFRNEKDMYNSNLIEILNEGVDIE